MNIISTCALLIVLFLLSGNALASTCPVSNGTVNVNMPATVTVPRDAGVGTLLTGWVEHDKSYYTQFYANCNYTSTGGRAGMVWDWLGLASTGTSVKGYSNVNVVVYKTNVPGVGIAVQTIGYSANCGGGEWGGGWASIENYGLGGTGWGWVCVPTKAGYWQGGGRVAVALVKTGPITPGKVVHGTPFMSYLYLDEVPRWGGSNYYWYYNVTSTDIKVSSCNTPNVDVALGSYSLDAFAAVGSRSQPVKFSVNVSDCPANLNSVQYSFSFPGTTGSVANQGRFGLSGASTAKGVQVKLLQSDGQTTVELDKEYTLNGYNKATGGTYTIPLAAAYERVGNIEAGSANSELVFSMMYK
jgi:major type 1 subunit fimbrin (pilin)